MKKFKKIYVEITNRCNLKCSFCGKNSRKYKDMTDKEFSLVINKIKDYTDYIYLHVKGEPLLSAYFDSILTICDLNNIKVNITTNGVFVKERFNELNSHRCIRQINFSLHCENNKSNYFDDIFEVGKILSTKMFISYRIWNLENLNLDEKSTEIVEKIALSYELSTDIVQKIKCEQSVKIANNTYLNKDNLFVWPSKENGFDLDGFCYALSTHLGILSDGTVVPCCLDGNGEIKLGNIFSSSLESIINSDEYKRLLDGFRNNKSVNELCKNCNFRKRFSKM